MDDLTSTDTTSADSIERPHAKTETPATSTDEKPRTKATGRTPKAQTLEQQIAEAQAKVAEAQAKVDRLRAKARSKETGAKIVVGGAVLAEARQDARFRAALLGVLRRQVQRDADKARVAPLLAELEKLGPAPVASLPPPSAKTGAPSAAARGLGQSPRSAERQRSVALGAPLERVVPSAASRDSDL